MTFHLGGREVADATDRGHIRLVRDHVLGVGRGHCRLDTFSGNASPRQTFSTITRQVFVDLQNVIDQLGAHLLRVASDDHPDGAGDAH